MGSMCCQLLDIHCQFTFVPAGAKRMIYLNFNLITVALLPHLWLLTEEIIFHIYCIGVFITHLHFQILYDISMTVGQSCTWWTLLFVLPIMCAHKTKCCQQEIVQMYSKKLWAYSQRPRTKITRKVETSPPKKTKLITPNQKHCFRRKLKLTTIICLLHCSPLPRTIKPTREIEEAKYETLLLMKGTCMI
jgi:hypothetical protein